MEKQSRKLGIRLVRDLKTNSLGRTDTDRDLWIFLGDEEDLSIENLDPMNQGIFGESFSNGTCKTVRTLGLSEHITEEEDKHIIPQGGVVELISFEEINNTVDSFCRDSCVIGLEDCINEKCVWGRWKKDHSNKNLIIKKEE